MTTKTTEQIQIKELKELVGYWASRVNTCSLDEISNIYVCTECGSIHPLHKEACVVTQTVKALKTGSDT